MNYAIILAGGVGSRFWPFSRELEPKQFMKLIGNKSLIQDTFRRLSGIVSPKNIFFVTNKIYYYELKEQIAKTNIPEKNIILEPEGKNTAPAIGLCARLISEFDKEAVLIVLPSDHYIRKVSGFKANIRSAVDCARKGMLVTIGVKPAAPSTGYGYIKVTPKRIKLASGFAYPVTRFLEKPEQELANQYFKDKNFYWNSGIFIWEASAFLEELKKYLPQLHAQLKLISCVGDIHENWAKIKAVSVDYGIMEHSRRIALIPGSFEWSDLGSWDALSWVMPKDKKGNVFSGDHLDFGSSGTCIFSKGNRLITTLGTRDLIIADTPDALLVCDKEKTQDVKKIVESLKLHKRKEQLRHLVEKRPWGSFSILQSGQDFKIKLIEIQPKKRLSLQRHLRRAEHWVVVSGTAKITSGKKILTLRSNQSIYIPIGMKHRLENPSNSLLKIVEVQTGAYLEEDDIKRFDDDFRR